MFTVAEARDRVLDAVGPLETEERNVGEALGYVVADTLVAPHPLPRFDNSAMDGYALRSEDVADASDASPATLRIAGEVRAGDPGEVTVASGTAARIMTGAPVPPGANAVVPVELTEESSGEVVVKAPVTTAQHVRPAGDDLAAGAVLVSAGMELGPGELALLSTMGFSPLKVHRRPRVAVVVTGDELVAPEDDPGPGQIRDSNSIALRALVAEAAAEPIAFPPVPDDRAATVDALSKAAGVADLVVSSGGVAVGRYDFVKDVVAELGRIDLWRVAMQPGRPVVLGAIGPTPFLGLPGNPVSIHVGFEQFVRPAIRKLRGCQSLLRPTLLATLTETVTKTPGRLHFVRVRLAAGNGGWRATPTGPQGSHIQSSLIGCHGVARFGVEDTVLEEGTEVTVEVWRLP